MSSEFEDEYRPYRGFGLNADWLGNMFYPLYERLFDQDSGFVAELEQKLSASRVPINVELYVSSALGAGVVGGLVLWLVGLFTGYVLFRAGVGTLVGLPLGDPTLLWLVETLKVPFMVLSTGLVLGFFGFASLFGLVLIVPYFRASQRKREINMLLPDAISFMYALSVGGMSQLEIIDAIAAAEDTYGEVSREFRTIVQVTEYFDTDYRSAIRQQSIETPSEELAQFLTDMLSIIDSGGDMTRFLNDKKDQHFRTAQQEQEKTLETLELFGEVYITIAIFPLMLIIILIVLRIMGQGQQMVLFATIYGLIPLLGVGFLVLVSTVKHDEPGDGRLDPESSFEAAEQELNKGLFSRGLVDSFTGTYYVFDRIRNREGTYETMQVITKPHLFFRDNPGYTLAITLPAAATLVGAALVTGRAPTSWSGLVSQPVWGTFIYIYAPLLLVGVPLAIFREANIRARRGILQTLGDDLRKLSSANDTGLTLLESIETVAETSSGPLAKEFEQIHAKTIYGMNLKEALVVFNNKYRLPRLARTVKLISKAQEASSQISSVLTTAAQATENSEQIEIERRSRTRMQVVLILMTYLTLLGVMAVLKLRFIDVMANLTKNVSGGASGGGFGVNLDTQLLSLLFFHAVTIQAITSGAISGYIRDAELLSGVKYIVALLVVTLGVWMVVG